MPPISACALVNQTVSPWFYRTEGITWDVCAPEKNARKYGLIFSLIRDGATLNLRPARADMKLIETFLNSHPESLTKTQSPLPKRLPTIIAVMSESFFDPGLLKEVPPCTFTPTFCRLKKRGITGTLSVPTYGGNTTRTEFEFLTGVSLNNYPDHTYPFMSLVIHPLASLPSELKKLGYETIAIHPYKRTFWNRNLAYRHLGIDKFISEEAFAADIRREGYYIADSACVDRLAAELVDQRPQFIFIITMENHGPWNRLAPNIDMARRKAIPVPEGLSAEATQELQGYAYHVQNADRALAKIQDLVDRRNYPTVLMHFGDHLPALPLVYKNLGFDNGLEPWRQKTPFLITANFSVEPAELTLSTDFLASLILDAAHLPTSRFFALSSYFRELSFSRMDKTLEKKNKLTLSALQIDQFNLAH